MANPVGTAAGGIKSRVEDLSGGRQLALALVVAIVFARGLMSGKVQAAWTALWGPTKPLQLTAGSKSSK